MISQIIIFSVAYIFSKARFYLYGVYLGLFDDYRLEYPSLAATMSKEDIINHMKMRALPLQRVFSNRNWILFCPIEIYLR